MTVVARARRVIVVVIVGYNHSSILSRRWATIALVITGIVAIPHVDSFIVGIGIAPGGCSIVNLHLPADGGRRRLFPASRFHALILFADISPACIVLFYRTGTTPRTNAATSSTAGAAAAAAFLRLGGAPASLYWAIGTWGLSPAAVTHSRSRFTPVSSSIPSSWAFLPSTTSSITSFTFPHASRRPIVLGVWLSPVPCAGAIGASITVAPTLGALGALSPTGRLGFHQVIIPIR